MSIPELVALILYITIIHVFVLIHIEHALDRLRLEFEEMRKTIVIMKNDGK
jgi:uncharacterized membrane protein